MKYFLMACLFLTTAGSFAKEIKLNKSDSYYNSLSAKSIKINKRTPIAKHKINNLYPLPPLKKPSLNGNYYAQFAYKKSQAATKLTADSQSQPN